MVECGGLEHRFAGRPGAPPAPARLGPLSGYHHPMEPVDAPSRMLDPRVKTAWRIQTAIVAIPVAFFGLISAGALWVASSPMWLAILVGVAGLAFAVIMLWPVPEVRYRRWRWEVTDLEVRLQHGLIVIERVVIPMVRIQHVDTSQGPIMHAFGLSEVKVSTAAGLHAIPALADEDAGVLRDKIAVLARVRDDGGL